MDSHNFNFGSICRVCMCKEQKLYSILDYVKEDLQICEMLATATPFINFQNNDNLPKCICICCLNKLNITYHFQKLIIKSDKRMRALVENCYTQIECDNTDSNHGSDLEQTVIEEDNSYNSSKNSIDVIEASHEWLKDSTTKDITTIFNVERLNENHPVSNELSCGECGKVFHRSYNVIRHMEVHSKNRPFECQICKYRFLTKKKLDSHQLLHMNSNINDIQKSSFLKNTAQISIDDLNESREYKNAEMNSTISVENNKTNITEQHFLNITKEHKVEPIILDHEENNHIEEIINKDSKYNVKHLRKHDVRKQYKCPHCDRDFMQKSTLIDHIRVHTGEKPFLCPECGKSFQNSSNLRQHLLRHSNIKNYQCPICPSKFSCHSDRITHMSVHQKSKPYKCDICGSSFTRSGSLTKHKRLHLGERPYKCEECNMAFAFPEYMRRHMRKHTGEKPYSCKVCERTFAENGALNKHLRSHFGKNIFKCNECPEAFKYHIELRDHQILHYNKEQIS